MTPANSPTPLHPQTITPELGDDVLRYLGLDPRNPITVVLALVAKKYDLDPLLNEVAIINTGKGLKVYVTRDGHLTYAHKTGQLDGIVVDEERRNTTGDGFTAYVSVYRKDCEHPFRYGAQCKDTEPQAKRGFGPEQALARAERRALHRAFPIAGAGDAVDVDWDRDDEPDAAPAVVTAPETALERPVVVSGGETGTGVPPNRQGGHSADVEPTTRGTPDPARTDLTQDERRAVALVMSHQRTDDIGALRAREVDRLDRFLSDLRDGTAVVGQLDDGRWDILEPAGPGAQPWQWWADLERLTVVGAPIENENPE